MLALIGDLGTGKTALTKYIAQGLGIRDSIVSPTFTIVREYTGGRLPLYHFDVYRLADSEEMFNIGAEEYFYEKGGICVIEWADIVEDILPADARYIYRVWSFRRRENIQMYILALESTGQHASVALTDESGNIEEILNPGRLNHLETMVPMIDELMKKCQLQLSDITAIAASRGPIVYRHQNRRHYGKNAGAGA